MENFYHNFCAKLEEAFLNYTKTNGHEPTEITMNINDFVEQDLISEPGYPDGLDDGLEALVYQMDLRDRFKNFSTDFDCAGRNGMFDDEEKFVVWNKEDITKL